MTDIHDRPSDLDGGYVETVVDDPALYDALEVHGVTDCGDGCVEQVDDIDADFFSTYVHHIEGGIYCVGDFETKGEAERYAVEVAERFRSCVIGWPNRD